ncbi:MAG TPA: IlvD/Edd family dehydratase [Allosphingosinicella sp.]|nr:IlvD/Edd family dehydratase [Allosphingosinicella sp.]
MKKLRSTSWFGRNDVNTFMSRGWLRGPGQPGDMFDGRPVIGICNSWSELTPCNAHLRDLAERVRRGVLEAGGFPLEFPVMSLGETLMRPTAMLYRNLASMDVEESIRANPLDGLVLLVGCDKTTPALMMGAASCDLPTITVSGGAMLNGRYRGQEIGSGTTLWQFDEEVRAGRAQWNDFIEAEEGNSRSIGHCMTMGTASTMANMAEALGMALPQNAAIPAADSRRSVLAQLAGRRIVEMVRQDVRMSSILTRAAFENAIIVNGAVGGSTNAVIHLIAIAGRMGVDIGLDDWDRLGRDVPTLVNLMPSGRYLMEDYYYAGGLPVVIRRLEELIHKDAMTVNGRTLWENCENAECFNDDVIRTRANPLTEKGGIAVLKGNLAPQGAVLKPSAASPELMRHTGRAVVFDNYQEYKDRINGPDLDVAPEDILVLKNAGPKGYPGMPEVGCLELPRKILQAGVRDMIRISDARMSGTSYGTVILHVAPEAALGGVLALVRTGDRIEVDVAARRLHLEVDEAELAKRKAEWKPPPMPAVRGYEKLYVDHVLQADQGADLDFLVGGSRAGVPADPH